MKGDKDYNRMRIRRCVELMILAMANELEEVWISHNPILFFVYVMQYLPDVGRW